MRIHVYASPRYLTVVYDDGRIFQAQPLELNLQYRTKQEAEALAVLTSLDNETDITEVCSDEPIDETTLNTTISSITGRRSRKRLEKLAEKIHGIKFSKIPTAENQAAIIERQTL
jgi:hypothetical protein